MENALQSDARGYWCEACTHRFATAADVFADRCPHCQSLQLVEVVGFVCPADQHATLGPRGKFAVPCEQCGGRTAGLQLPTAADLKTWIARAPTPTPAAEPSSP